MSNQVVATDTIQVVTFTITEKSSKRGNYAIPIDQVKEIRTVDAITKIPKSKSYVKGLMNLRGKIIPIIDVNSKIGLASAHTDSAKQRILVVDVNDTLNGLLVDEVNEVMRLSSGDIEPPPTGAFDTHAFIKGIAKRDDKLIILLDASKLLEEYDGNMENEAISQDSDSTTEQTGSSNTGNDDQILPEIEQVINETAEKK